MIGSDYGSMYVYCDMYGVEVVDGCATYDSLDRLNSTVDDQFAKLLSHALSGAQYDDDGLLADDVEYALKQVHEGKLRLYD